MWSMAVRRGIQFRTGPTLAPSRWSRPRTIPLPSRPFHSTLKQNDRHQLQPRIVPPQYQRFRNNKIPFYQSKRFWVTTGTGTVLFGGYYVSHLEKVPISGRTRFMDITPKQEEGNYRKHVLLPLVAKRSS